MYLKVKMVKMVSLRLSIFYIQTMMISLGSCGKDVIR